MGRTNADIVRSLLEAWHHDRVEDVLAFLHRDVVFEPMLRPGRSVYFGHGDLRTLLADQRRSANGGHARFDDFIELPDGRIEAHGHQVLADGTAGPKASPTFTVRDGLVVHIQGWGANDPLGL